MRAVRRLMMPSFGAVTSVLFRRHMNFATLRLDLSFSAFARRQSVTRGDQAELPSCVAALSR